MSENASASQAPAGAPSLAVDNTPTIRLEGIYKTYDLGEVQVHAIRGVSL
jgi:hypothetical protein